ncbi:MAG: CGNR zinc finger domain-containing protein [Gemmatimonadaceae bacterium]
MVTTTTAPGYAWDFCGGHLALDFTNTVSDRGGEAIERLNSYGDLLSWAAAREIVGAAAARRLAKTAADRPQAAEDAVLAATTLRQALYRVIAVTADGRKVAPADLAIVDAHVRASFAHARLAPASGRLALTFDLFDNGSLLGPVLMPVVHAAMDLLTTDAIARVRTCAEPTCAWLFLDVTRSGTRRWCDMKICGNRTKARRYRERH